MKLLPYLLKILINIESLICTFYKNEPKILLLERITVFEKMFLKITKLPKSGSLLPVLTYNFSFKHK